MPATVSNAVLILRQPAQRCVDSAGKASVMFPVFERNGPIKHDWLCLWTGDKAEAFYSQHLRHLKAGTPLAMTLTNLRPHASKPNSPCIRADVLTCDIAAPRWPAQVPSTPQPAAHACA